MVIDTMFIFSVLHSIIFILHVCHLWDSVMDSLFLRFSCTISNPVPVQELGIVVNSYVE